MCMHYPDYGITSDIGKFANESKIGQLFRLDYVARECQDREIGEIGRNWFANMVVNEWNNLREHVLAAKSTESCKWSLDNYIAE